MCFPNARNLVLALLFVLTAIPAAIQAQSPPIALTPTVVESGSPELIRVHGTYQRVEGEWLGHKLLFFPGSEPNDWYALAGVDVEAPAGPSQLKVTAYSTSTEAARDLSIPVPIQPAHYRTGVITVEPKFVEPGPDEQKLIEAASKAKQKVFAATDSNAAGKRLWSGSFLAPVKAAATDSFGTRRTYNGKLASIHKGTDFRASTGTPVLAGNSGTIVLAQPLYYEGNCVMIDHGLGLVSISMHLSRIDVKSGQHIEKGEQVGLSGATGRVTGPHLHWAIRWEGAMLDPAKLLKLNLSGIR